MPKLRMTCDEILKQHRLKITKPKTDLNNSGSICDRPKRASAQVARSYLKEVMQSRYGDTTGEASFTPSCKKHSIQSRCSSKENIMDKDSDMTRRTMQKG